MEYFLENNEFITKFDSHGAELKSVLRKSDYREYMWYGDSKFWGRTSPVLFPFVGEVRDGKYSFEGKEIKMGQHGFARDSEFALVSQSETSIWFVLEDNEKSYVNYPFRFKLEIGYELVGNKLDVIWRVSNPGQDREDQTLYFSIGAHPAFNCPFPAKENPAEGDTAVDGKIGYKMGFGKAEEFHHHGNLSGTCTHEDIVQKLDENKLTIDYETFNRSTYIVEDKQLEEVSLIDPSGHAYITVKFDTPLVGIWSPIGKHAPFICIEPWWGRADYDDYEGDLTAREYGNAINVNEEFSNVYSIVFD